VGLFQINHLRRPVFLYKVGTMTIVLLYIGIALIVGGWLTLAWFAAKQITAQKEYERLPQKWEEVRQNLIHKRQICRVAIIVGLLAIGIFLLL